jgi:hypothetical protein
VIQGAKEAIGLEKYNDVQAGTIIEAAGGNSDRTVEYGIQLFGNGMLSTVLTSLRMTCKRWSGFSILKLSRTPSVLNTVHLGLLWPGSLKIHPSLSSII